MLRAYQAFPKDQTELCTILETLDSKELFLNIKFNGGLNLLHIAIQDKNVGVVRLMKEKLPCFEDIVNEVTDDEKKVPPLVMAAEQSSIELVKVLYDSGANP